MAIQHRILCACV